MAIPKAKFIGLCSADPDRYGLPRNVGIKLNDEDVRRAKELLKYRWFQRKDWQEEIKRMLAIRNECRCSSPKGNSYRRRPMEVWINPPAGSVILDPQRGSS